MVVRAVDGLQPKFGKKPFGKLRFPYRPHPKDNIVHRFLVTFLPSGSFGLLALVIELRIEVQGLFFNSRHNSVI